MNEAMELAGLVAAIGRENRLQGPFLEASVAGMLPDERAELDAYLRFCTTQGIDLEYLARSYNTIVMDTLREQVFFQRHDRYRHGTYADVAGSVYQNDDYMRRYMYGLALTTYLWPNHREMRRFFLEQLPRERTGTYLEIGPGHGMFFLAALRMSRFTRFEGIDISPTSCAMTEAIVASGQFGRHGDYAIRCRDFLAADDEPASCAAVVMGEVLEHVETPLAFLRKIRSLVAPGGFVFVTTAINAPAVDHIWLFRSPAEVTAMAAEAGLQVTAQLVVPYSGMSLEESLRTRMPVNIALAMSRAG
ncbi:MAG: class I SAM-dependent methyltransferase [bacterium]|jgi:2-polyprenyl-3-methyl-5-hydroxy-6-metoxy-1,4-benzoquinol methylase|nr:class I SAM-dependent methyltransferase [Rhodocyclaceae bacterium]MCA4901763.1 class I SAM-dependent methyltransferase [Rhodocyclaceae bacterium]MCE2979049.1 class I SAM-dependent methyltransferase [Betaproteobacteria bacterium]